MAWKIVRRGDKWRARYEDDTGREVARHFERKTDAQRWLDEQTAKLVTGQYIDPARARTTLATFYADWGQRQQWAGGTRKAMNLAMADCTFTTVPMDRLRLSHAEQWVKSMTTRGLAPGTVRTRVNNVHGVVRGAIRDRYMALDPMDSLKLPRRRRAEVAMRLPSAQEVAAVLAVADPTTRLMVLLAVGAGLRIGELCGLHVADVNFLRRTIQVRRQLQRAGGGAVEVLPPKYGSERDVYVPDELLAEVSAYITAHRASGEPTRWLFVGPSGEPLHQNTGGDRWRRACRMAGVSGVKLHDLRHHFASGLIAQGVDVVAVQRALGHQTATVTLNTYAHLWPNAEDRTRTASRTLLTAISNAMIIPEGDAQRTEGPF